jgi:hypothetical protein
VSATTFFDLPLVFDASVFLDLGVGTGPLRDVVQRSTPRRSCSFAGTTALLDLWARTDLAATNPRIAVVQEPRWLAVFTANVRRVAGLGPGWDGPASVAIARKALFEGAQIVRRALEGVDGAIPPYVVPGGDGSVQIEWHEKHGELELDIDKTGAFWIWGRDHRTGAEFEGEGEKACALFYRWAPWVASKSDNGADVPFPSATATFGIGT